MILSVSTRSSRDLPSSNCSCSVANSIHFDILQVNGKTVSFIGNVVANLAVDCSVVRTKLLMRSQVSQSLMITVMSPRKIWVHVEGSWFLLEFQTVCQCRDVELYGHRYDSVKYRVMKPLSVFFESVSDRQHFIRLFCNYKRLYHQTRIRDELMYEFKHDQRRGCVTWLAAEVLEEQESQLDYNQRCLPL